MTGELQESTMNLKAIGIFQSCYQDRFGAPRQPGLVPAALGKILIYPEFQPQVSLQGLADFSHVWVLFHFHKNNVDTRFHAKVHPPRLDGEAVGVFATRSPHRPNSIGLSLLEIIGVENDGIVVKGTDLINETPVFDIKPYLPEVEAKPDAKSGWCKEVTNSFCEIVWDEESLRHIETWSKSGGHVNLFSLIDETLKLDPRPNLYKGYEGKESPYRSTHAVRFYDGDVHFQFFDVNKIRIVKILYPGHGL
jgi:tRNA (adenine37-N6)-methyltransferase